MGFYWLISFGIVFASQPPPKWMDDLRSTGVHQFIVCGTSRIGKTQKALASEFLTGADSSGLLISDMIPMSTYWDLLTQNKLDDAKLKLREALGQAHLWKYTEKFEDLGSPSLIEFPFTATVKDCLEGARTSLGKSCENRDKDTKIACCKEKFLGPVVYWGANKQYKLMYSPDPSTRLKVPGESKHRYCLASDILKTK